MKHLRPYQTKAFDEIRVAMAKIRRIVFVLPTGGGKTVVFTFIAKSASLKGKRVYVVVHRSEIIDQICRALDDVGVSYGRIQPGRSPTRDLIQVAMINTIVRRLDYIDEPDLVIIDESHHAITGSYTTLVNHYASARVLGVTATPERLDGRGLAEQFDHMIQGPSTRELIDAGFLADYEYYAPKIAIDLSGVKTKMGDYESAALAEALDKPTITGDAVAHYRTFLNGKSAIAFCVTVAHAEHVAASFTASGIPAASIDGSMSQAERTERVNGLKNGIIKVLTSCDLISEGFDVPDISGCIMLRPTKSLSMCLQQWGRALRPKADGSKAIILDHVGNAQRHGTPKTPRAWTLNSQKRKQTDSGIRQCDLCFKAFEPDEEIACDKSDEVSCILYKKPRDAPTALREIEQVEGTLSAISETPEWAHGINLIRASGPEWKALLAKADTIDKLKEIQVMRGYKLKWCYFIMSRRKNGNSRRYAAHSSGD